MVAATGALPSRPDGSGSVSFTSFNIRSGRNRGLEVALRAMDQLGVDIGFLLETKLTGGIHTRYSSGYSVLALTATSVWQGGIALFWRGNNSYEVEETQIWGVNIISLHLMMGKETDRRRFQRVSVQMPRYYSNHRALVAVIYAEGGGELKRYRRWMQQFPISLPRSLQKQLNAEYEELKRDVVRPPLRERPANSWITIKT
jgi:hypothetical protein